jgi:beta-aspartyl-peptidase (threonine type)
MPHTTSDDLRFRAKLLRIGCFATLAAFVVLLTLIVIVFPMVARTVGLTTPSADEAAVRTVLDAQVAAWNKGDLDGFMAGYWRDDNLMFTSGDKITKGWNATRDRYQTRYFTPDKDGKLADRGELAFGELQVESLSPTAVLVRGRYFLKVGARTDTGRFTLTFRKLPDGWKITSDHTSVDCPPEKKDKPPGGG